MLRCPKCKGAGPFSVGAIQWVETVLTDQYKILSVDRTQQLEWEGENETQCLSCKHAGQMRSFECRRNIENCTITKNS